MKKILLLFFICLSGFGQTKKVALTIDDLQKKNTQFTKYSVFSSYSKSDDFSGFLKKTSTAILDVTSSNTLWQQNEKYIELEIPYLDEMISVQLYKVEIKTENFQIDTDKKKNIPFEKGVHYRGIIKNDMNSLASFNFFNNQLNGIISSKKYGNLTIGKLNTKNNLLNYIVYSDADLKETNPFTCANSVLPSALPNPDTDQNRSANLTNKCVTVYFELGYSVFQANGNSATQTGIWINSIFNNVQTLYNNDGINVALKSVFIWTTPDPFTSNTIYGYLFQFNEVRPYFNADIGQLLTIGTQLGGVAAKVGGLCSENDFAYSDVYFAYQDVPVFSWPVQSITHELGHLMGSHHTHDCVWNGNNTTIDSCGPQAGFPGITAEGNSCTATDFIPENGGTIMSYCYILPGVGNNFSNGFGAQPAARIIQSIESSACLGTDCVNSCISQVNNLQPTQITADSFLATWSDGNSSNNLWEVAVASYPYIPTVWQESSTTSLLIDNLEPNTYYTFFVRASCGNNTISGISSSNYFATAHDTICDGIPFTDTSGPSENYSDNQNWMRTIYPSATDRLKVTFNSIAIEQDFDFLHIYNGTSTTDPEMVPGGITGNSIVGPFISTHSSGALTFHFISDTNTNEAGWDATINCVDLSVNNPDLIDFSYYPNPVKNTLEITSKTEIQNTTVFSIDGKLLFESNKKQLNSNINMSNYASGTYIVRLQFESKPVTFKVVKQ